MEYADTLSRAPLDSRKTCITASVTIEPIRERILSLLDNMRLQQLQMATEEDATMRKLIKYIQEGWPTKQEEIPEA